MFELQKLISIIQGEIIIPYLASWYIKACTVIRYIGAWMHKYYLMYRNIYIAQRIVALSFWLSSPFEFKSWIEMAPKQVFVKFVNFLSKGEKCQWVANYFVWSSVDEKIKKKWKKKFKIFIKLETIQSNVRQWSCWMIAIGLSREYSLR